VRHFRSAVEPAPQTQTDHALESFANEITPGFSLADRDLAMAIKRPQEGVVNSLEHGISDVGKACFICCTNKANAVFMDCRHGGVCVECAIDTWKSGERCTLCRNIITEIVEVEDIESVGVSKIVRSIHKLD